MNELTQEKLKEYLSYNQDDGSFTWKKHRGRLAPLGSKAGHIRPKDGYIQIKLFGKLYLAHRLVWLYMTGKMPNDKIDHINHIRGDNRWDNIRESSQTENNRNASKRDDNTSGYTGVYWHKRDKRWFATINVDKKQVSLGYHIKKVDAIQARLNAEIRYGYHKNHGQEKCVNYANS